MSHQDASFKHCFDDLAQIDADLRALEAAGCEPGAGSPEEIDLLMRDCCLRLRQQRESMLVRLQFGIAEPAWPSAAGLPGLPLFRARRLRPARR